MSAFASPLAGAAFALAAVLALIALATWLARRLGLGTAARPGGGATLALEASLALDPRRRVHLLRIADRRLLLLTGGSGDLLLGWLPESGNGTDPGAGTGGGE